MKTLAQRRRDDRDRKRRQRAEARAAGVPRPAAALHAIAEAVSFAASSGVNIERARAGEVPSVTLPQVFATAVEILVQRHGYDAAQSRNAVSKLLQPRGEHRWPSHVPTHSAANSLTSEPA